MKYCQACGQSNEDDARFCEKCGAAVAHGAGAAPAAQTAVPSMGSTLSMFKDKKIVTYVAGGAVALIVLVVLWSMFLKPMSVTAYSSKADLYTGDLYDSYNAINEEISNYSTDDSTLKLTNSEWESSKKAIQREEKKIKEADTRLRRLRPPSDLKSAHERILSWADFYGKKYVPALDQALESVSGDMTYERVARQLQESHFLAKDMQREQSRGWLELTRSSKDVDLTIVSSASGD